jgi:hypothetical protein
MLVAVVLLVLSVFSLMLFSAVLKLAQEVGELKVAREQHADILRVLARRTEPSRRAPTAEPF